MEISDISYTPEQLTVFLLENGLEADKEYNPSSNTNKKNILKTALSILEAIANNPNLMKNYKNEDISIMDFAESIQNRISQLERKIRLLPADDVSDNIADGASWTYIFRE